MREYTYSELRDKVQRETDTQDELFIPADEMIGYFNDAIDEAEIEVMRLRKDYFLKSKLITLKEGKSEYSLPGDLYARKIRRIMYNNGSRLYPIHKVKLLNKFEEISETNKYGESADYKYYLRHDNASKGHKLVLVPKAREEGPFAEIFYIRDANRVPLTSEATQTEIDDTVIDIPEAKNYIIQYVKNKIWEKETNPMLSKGEDDLKDQRDKLEYTLDPETIEDDDTVEEDYTPYDEHS